MKGLVIILLVLVAVSLFSFITLSADNSGIKISKDNSQFKTFTSAVCEEKNNLRYCRDVLFVNCNGKVSKASEIKECIGFKIDNQVSGFAVFENN